MSVSRNIAANILGKALSAVFLLVFVPLYVRILGIEAYGLIGLFTTLQLVFFLADLGLSGAFTREVARLSAFEDATLALRDLCRTFEVLFLVLGFTIALVIVVSAPLIAAHWVRAEQLSPTTIRAAVQLMAISIGLQFPVLLYQGGLLGLQRQLPLNVLVVSAGFTRGAGAVLVLTYIAPSIEVFFGWQATVSVIQLAAARTLVWNSLPADSRPPKYDLAILRGLWRFAMGMAAIALTSVILTQVDKIILSKMLPLKVFGYYSLAGVAASVPILLAVPINNAVYPRFTQLVALDDICALTLLYHRVCQLLAVLTIPVALVLAVFSYEVMLLWTGNQTTAAQTSVLVRVLVIGSMLAALVYIPYALQLAFAWTKLPLKVNLVAIAVLVPLLLWLTAEWGALGASFVWLALNFGYLIGNIQLMHRRLLPDEKWAWYLNDLAKPFGASALVVAIARLTFQDRMTGIAAASYLALTVLAAIAAAALSAAYVREFVASRLALPLRTSDL